MTRTAKMLWWLGGVAAGAVVVGGVAYAASSKPHAATGGASAPTSPTVATSLSPSVAYLFAAKVPQGVTTPDQLVSALQAAGWIGPVVAYFGPTGALQAGVKVPFTVDSSMYVAAATWSGAANAPIPPGVSAVVSATLPQGA